MKWKILKYLIIFIVICSATIYAAFMVVSFTGYVKEKVLDLYAEGIRKVTKVEVVREYVSTSEVPMTTLLSKVAREHKIPEVALKALYMQESAGGAFLYRFEPEVYGRLKQKLKEDDNEVRMLASSHGALQVMGFNAENECGVHWSKLYDSMVGLECGAKILKNKLEKHEKEKDVSKKVWLAMRDYNGAGEAAERHADKVMAWVGKLLLSEIDGL